MSSQQKIDSARANGAKSQGPKTEEGRQTSSRNALKHGLYSSSVVLHTEPCEQYQEMLDGYIRELQPEGPVELDLVEEMVAAKWRLRRLRAIETDLLDDEIVRTKDKLDDEGRPYTEITPLTDAYTNLAQSPTLAFLTRHQSRLERAYSRALKNLLELQRLRKAVPAGPEQILQERTQSQPESPTLLAAKPETTNEKPETARERKLDVTSPDSLA
jgi:hypothetical protein